MVSLYCGMNLDWNYQERFLDISMPNYMHKQLLKDKWKTPKQTQFFHFNPAPVNYGKKLNISIPKPDSHKLDKAGKTYIEQVVSCF